MMAAISSERYLAAAARVGQWLASAAVEDDQGRRWPDQPEVSTAEEPSLGWGGLGPIVFFAEGYRTLGDDGWLEQADLGGRRIRNLMADLSPDIPPGLFTGIAGWAVVFHELDRAGLDFAGETVRVFELLRDRAHEHADGLQWAETTEVLWGTAGIGFLLLSIGYELLGDDALDLAARAGDWILSQAHTVPSGLRWDLGPGPRSRRPGLAGIWFPNFAHGSAGIGAFLARLGAATNDHRYTDAARRAASWILTTCRTDNGACAAHHHDPTARKGDLGMGFLREADDDSAVYTMGWCHGPPGLGWFFRELQLATGEAEWADWVARTAEAVRTSGIPDQLKPGFWDNVGRCCGSAGVAEYFLDLHTWRNKPDDLAFALTMVDDLLERATTDEQGMRWHNIEIRADPPQLPAETTFFQGASGIGLTLLRLGRHLNGDRSTTDWPHAPNWTVTSIA